jgi:hypothetical protein
MSDDTPAELAAGARMRLEAALLRIARMGVASGYYDGSTWVPSLPQAPEIARAALRALRDWLAGSQAAREMEEAENDALTARLREAEDALRKIKAGERHVHDGEEYVILLSAERCRDIAVVALGGSDDR